MKRLHMDNRTCITQDVFSIICLVLFCSVFFCLSLAVNSSAEGIANDQETLQEEGALHMDTGDVIEERGDPKDHDSYGTDDSPLQDDRLDGSDEMQDEPRRSDEFPQGDQNDDREVDREDDAYGGGSEYGEGHDNRGDDQNFEEGPYPAEDEDQEENKRGDGDGDGDSGVDTFPGEDWGVDEFPGADPVFPGNDPDVDEFPGDIPPMGRDPEPAAGLKALYKKGTQHYLNKRYEEALTAFLEVQERSTRPTVIRYMFWNIARCYEKMNDTGSAIDYYERFLDSNPTDKEKEEARQRIQALKGKD